MARNTETVLIVLETANPSASPGYQATIGERGRATDGTIWWKVGTLATDWEQWGEGLTDTLAETYANGAAAADQTMALLDTKGGKVIFDGTTGTFTGTQAWTTKTRTTGIDGEGSSIYAASMEHTYPTSTPGAGFGVGIQFKPANSGGTVTFAAGIVGQWHTATAGSEIGRLRFLVRDTGAEAVGIDIYKGGLEAATNATLAVSAAGAARLRFNGTNFQASYAGAAYVDLGGAAGGAPIDATYIVQTANATLSNEQAIGALATGILKGTTGTGVISIAVSGTDYPPPAAQYLVANLTGAPAQSRRLQIAGTLVTAIDTDGGALGDYTWTLTLADTSVVAATYNKGATFTVDAQGRLTGATSAMSALGDTMYGGAAGLLSRLPGNITTTLNVLVQTGDGAASAAPAWSTIAAAGGTTGTGAADRIAFWSGASTLSSSANLKFFSSTGTGNVNIGEQTADQGARLYVSGGATNAGIYQQRSDATATNEATWRSNRSRGTVGAEATVVAGDEIGGFLWYGWTDSWQWCAGIRVQAATGWGAAGADSPGQMGFYTTPDGSGTAIRRQLIDRDGNHTFTQGVQTSGSPTGWTFTGGAHTTLAASTEAPDVLFDLARNVQFATGALATQRAVIIEGVAYLFAGASTLTTAITVDIAPPNAGSNATITNLYGLRVGAGDASHGTASAGSTYSAIVIPAHTLTYLNTTGITGTGPSTLRVEQLTVTDPSTIPITYMSGARISAPTMAGTVQGPYMFGLWLGTTAVNHAALNVGINGSEPRYATLYFGAHTLTVDPIQAASTDVSGASQLFAEQLTVTSAGAYNCSFAATAYLRTLTFAGSATATDVATLRILPTSTRGASTAGMQHAGIEVKAGTVTFTGTTGITSAPGVAGIRIGQITVTDASAMTVNDSASLYIAAAPVAAGSAVLTRTYAIWSDAGTNRFDGTVQLGLVSSVTGALQFQHASSAFNTVLQAGNATATVTYTLPLADGTSGQVLSTNASGVLSWATAAGGGTSASKVFALARVWYRR